MPRMTPGELAIWEAALGALQARGLAGAGPTYHDSTFGVGRLVLRNGAQTFGAYDAASGELVEATPAELHSWERHALERRQLEQEAGAEADEGWGV